MIDREKEIVEKIFVAAVIIMLVVTVSAILYAVHQTIYRRGQIDALTGEVRYELQEQENGEMLWKEIEP